MKKIFTTLLIIALGTITTFAKSYTGKLVVTVNGEILSDKTASIDVDQQGDGTYNLSLKDFSINVGGQEINVGTIIIPASPYNVGDVRLLQADREVPINNLGDVPINLLAQETADKLHANININFAGMTKFLMAISKHLAEKTTSLTDGTLSKAWLQQVDLRTWQKDSRQKNLVMFVLAQREKRVCWSILEQ